MALSLTKVTAYKEANKHVRVYDVTFDNSYPTGGESLTAADIGLRKIELVEGLTATNSAGTLGLPLRYDYTNSKLQALRYDGASAGKASLEEAANAFDASAYSARLKFIGY